MTERFVIDGLGIANTYVQLDDGSIVPSAEPGPVDGLTVVEITTIDGVPVSIEVEDAYGERFVIDSENGTVMREDGIVIAQTTAEDGRDRIRFIDAEEAGFEYQSFGAWVTNLNSSSGGGGRLGVGSVGDESTTLPASAPDARYSGSSIGLAVLTGDFNEMVETASDVNVDVYGGFSRVRMESINTRITGSLNGSSAAAPAPDMDFETAFTGFDGTDFSAPMLGDSGVGFFGEVRGQFYGPNGEEVGGVYDGFGNASGGDGIEIYGSFGARDTGTPPPPDPDLF